MASRAGSPLHLRYWFDDLEQALHHLQERRGRLWLLFNQQIALASPVILEAATRRSAQTCVLRGEAALQASAARGAWLSLFGQPDENRARFLAAAAGARASKRLPSDWTITARGDAGRTFGRLLDLSLSGARIAGVNDLARPGRDLDLALFGAGQDGEPLARATVVWQRGNESGVHFRRRHPDERRHIGQLFDRLSGEWAHAIEASHTPLCRCLAESGRTTDEQPPLEGITDPRGRAPGGVGSSLRAFVSGLMGRRAG